MRIRTRGARLFFILAFAALFSAVPLTRLVGISVSALPARRNAVEFEDRHGLPLGTILASDENHAVAVPLRRVSPTFLRAILAAEDARFFSHGAVDPPALLRAAWQWFVFGSAQSGGSTITMQLARMIIPSPSTVRGKLIQMLTAERIALCNSPETILAAYINRIPMGGNLYGVEAAARAYFGEPASDLDVAQSALLASLPNDPTAFDPREHWAALKARQRYVLDRMVALGWLSAAAARRAFAQELHLRAPDAGVTDAQQLLFRLYPQLPAHATRVRTSIDRPLQRFVQAQAAQILGALAARNVTDAAALVIENHTGEVLAYVGSPDYFSDAALGRNDGVQALRQPGSSLKPFMYELALERGTIQTNSILQDVPTTYAIPGGRLYRPQDYSHHFAGPVRVRYALANSLNVPAVRVLAQVGVARFLARLRELGFTRLRKPSAFYGLGLTLGSGEVSLWELAHAYLTMARGGRAIPLAVMDRVQVPHGTQIGSAQMWGFLTNVLADSHARAESFGVHSVLAMPFASAVKTGTSSDFRDTWTVGFTRDDTVAVWVGNFNGSAMRDVSGVTGAAPLWNRIMLHLAETQKPAPFPTPRGFVRVPICATTGEKPQPGCTAILREYLLPRDLVAYAHPKRVRVAGGSILYPSDGATFLLWPTHDPALAQMQRIKLRASGAHVAWSVNGTALAPDGNGDVFWRLRLGEWRLRARSANGAASMARISVIAPPTPLRPGFTLREK